MLTDAKIRKIKPDGVKTLKETDSGGLRLWVYLSGKKSFKIKYRYNGKERTDTVGQYPSVSLADARKRRDDIKALLAEDIDPALRKVTEKEAAIAAATNTFSTVADSYLDKLSNHKPPRAPRTISKNTSLLNEAKAQFGNIPIQKIETHMIARLIEKRIQSGHLETAKRLKTTVGSVFRHAMQKGIAKSDPTVALAGLIPKGEVRHRSALLGMDEVGKLMVAIDKDTGHQTTKIAIRLLILFAIRPVELRGMKWVEVSISERKIDIPKERMKARKAAHTVMLSEVAISLLSELHALTGWSEYLFPSSGSKNPFMSENTMNQSLRRMGYSGQEVTSHGWRATFSTNANESLLWSPDAIERYCARGDKNAIRDIYNRGAYLDERRRLADWWSEQVYGAYNEAKNSIS